VSEKLQDDNSHCKSKIKGVYIVCFTWRKKSARTYFIYVDEEKEVIGNPHPMSYRNVRRKPSGLPRSKWSLQKLQVTEVKKLDQCGQSCSNKTIQQALKSYYAL